jgi:hypothetical protein
MLGIRTRLFRLTVDAENVHAVLAADILASSSYRSSECGQQDGERLSMGIGCQNPTFSLRA